MRVFSYIADRSSFFFFPLAVLADEFSNRGYDPSHATRHGSSDNHGGGHREPEFVNHVQNVTVALGRDVDLDCQVKHVGGYKVSWM